jgi:hypothetical protein
VSLGAAPDEELMPLRCGLRVHVELRGTGIADELWRRQAHPKRRQRCETRTPVHSMPRPEYFARLHLTSSQRVRPPRAVLLLGTLCVATLEYCWLGMARNFALSLRMAD